MPREQLCDRGPGCKCLVCYLVDMPIMYSPPEAADEEVLPTQEDIPPFTQQIIPRAILMPDILQHIHSLRSLGRRISEESAAANEALEALR